jgi:glycosyltransferase involved in cell wall biosynthesis
MHDYATATGGAELSLFGLRDGLRERGHDVRLLASSAGDAHDGGLADVRCFGTTSRFRTLLQTANPSAALGLRRTLDTFQPDVVHVRMFLTQLSPLILPLLRDVRTLYEVAWYRPVCPLGTKMLPGGSSCESHAGIACLRDRCLPLHDWAPLMLQMKLWHRWRSSFDRVIANSEAIRGRLLADGIAPVDVIWLAVPVRPTRPPLSDPPTVAFAGRLVVEKGLDQLLRAFAQVVAEMPEARLIVAGDGPERARLREFAAASGLAPSISWLGHLSRTALEERLGGAWVQVVPSRWEEPFGMVAAEAMMRGTAVIATGTGGLREIVEEGTTGLLVPPGDVGALARSMLQLLRNREQAEAMGRASRAVALARFGEPQYVEAFLRQYESMRCQAEVPYAS